MNISGVRPTEDFYKYNAIRINELRNKQILAAQKANLVKGESEPVTSVKESDSIIKDQEFTIFNYAINYTGSETLKLKGAESDIESLDMKKAVSDMEKDQILHQYQYFIGSNKMDGKDGESLAERIFRSEENFAL